MIREIFVEAKEKANEDVPVVVVWYELSEENRGDKEVLYFRTSRAEALHLHGLTRRTR